MHGKVNRLKHYLAKIHHSIKPCTKVSEDVRLECKIGIERNKNKKEMNCLKKLAWAQIQWMRMHFVTQMGLEIGVWVGNLFLGDPWISSPFQNLDKVLWIPNESKKKERKCIGKWVVLCIQRVFHSIQYKKWSILGSYGWCYCKLWVWVWV